MQCEIRPIPALKLADLRAPPLPPIKSASLSALIPDRYPEFKFVRWRVQLDFVTRLLERWQYFKSWMLRFYYQNQIDAQDLVPLCSLVSICNWLPLAFLLCCMLLSSNLCSLQQSTYNIASSWEFSACLTSFWKKYVLTNIVVIFCK